MTESHLRHLAVVLRALEEAMLEIEDALKGVPEGDMSIYEDDIPQAARPAIRDHIEKIRDQIRTFKETYGLAPQLVSNRGRVWAKLLLLSIDLTETTSRHLRAYGEIPEEEQEPLDDRLANMIALVESLKKSIP
jgi:hypothetical protein